MKRLTIIIYFFIVSILITGGGIRFCAKADSQITEALSVDEIFEEWLERANEIKSCEMTSNITVEYYYEGQSPIKSEVEAVSYFKGSNMMSERTIPAIQKTYRIYEIGKERYDCYPYGDGYWWPYNFELPQINLENQRSMFESIHNKNAMIFQDTVNETLIAGRQCQQIKWTADVSKLLEQEKKFLLVITSSRVNEPDIIISMEDFQVTMDIIPEGLILGYEAYVEFNKSLLPEGAAYATKEIFTTTDFKINTEIDDDIFELPNEIDPAFSPAKNVSIVLIPGKEDTMAKGDIVCLNTTTANDETEAFQTYIDRINDQGGLAIIAHPDLSNTNAEFLKEIQNYIGIEIFDTQTFIWDEVLEARISQGKKVVWGFATDDAHLPPHFGMGFIMVKSTNLNKDDIIESIQEGNFYSTTGILIDDILLSNDTIQVDIPSEMKILFIKSGGEIVQDSTGTSARYKITGNESYIRVEVRDPSVAGKVAWTQPFLITESNITNPYANPGSWYKGNVHCHSTESDGMFSPSTVINWYQENGYDFLAITDHKRAPADSFSTWILIVGFIGGIASVLIYTIKKISHKRT